MSDDESHGYLVTPDPGEPTYEIRIWEYITDHKGLYHTYDITGTTPMAESMSHFREAYMDPKRKWFFTFKGDEIRPEDDGEKLREGELHVVPVPGGPVGGDGTGQPSQRRTSTENGIGLFKFARVSRTVRNRRAEGAREDAHKALKAGLTDYQIRDLNDEINGLMREKNHWETQIVALGGANYKRGRQAMLDDDGKEVPGTRGYKYFGRAKELPGVREMFTKGAEAATEESARNASFQMFRNQGTEYFGDNDEMDLSLAQDEEALARAEWEQACADMAEILGLPSGSQLPPFPTPSKPLPPMTAGQSSSKRKASPEPASDEVIVDEATKKTKTDAPVESAAAVDQETIARQAAIAASFFSVLDPESMKAPVLASVQEMSQVLLDVRKKALREEYGV